MFEVESQYVLDEKLNVQPTNLRINLNVCGVLYEPFIDEYIFKRRIRVG